MTADISDLAARTAPWHGIAASALALDAVADVAPAPEWGRNLKVAIVHYWLVGMRGGEKVVEALCDMFPQADIFTHVYVPEAVSEKIRRHKVTTSFIGGCRTPAASTSTICR